MIHLETSYTTYDNHLIVRQICWCGSQLGHTALSGDKCHFFMPQGRVGDACRVRPPGRTRYLFILPPEHSNSTSSEEQVRADREYDLIEQRRVELNVFTDELDRPIPTRDGAGQEWRRDITPALRDSRMDRKIE